MKKLSSMNDVLDFAIAEQEAEHKRRFEMEYESLTS